MDCTQCCVAAKPRSSCCLQVVAGAPAQTAQPAEVEVARVGFSVIVYEGTVLEPAAVKPSCSSPELTLTLCVDGTVSGLLSPFTLNFKQVEF